MDSNYLRAFQEQYARVTAEFERLRPQMIQEIAERTHSTPELVNQRISYLVRTTTLTDEQFIMALLYYHRLP